MVSTTEKLLKLINDVDDTRIYNFTEVDFHILLSEHYLYEINISNTNVYKRIFQIYDKYIGNQNFPLDLIFQNEITVKNREFFIRFTSNYLKFNMDFYELYSKNDNLTALVRDEKSYLNISDLYIFITELDYMELYEELRRVDKKYYIYGLVFLFPQYKDKLQAELATIFISEEIIENISAINNTVFLQLLENYFKLIEGSAEKKRDIYHILLRKDYLKMFFDMNFTNLTYELISLMIIESNIDSNLLFNHFINKRKDLFLSGLIYFLIYKFKIKKFNSAEIRVINKYIDLIEFHKNSLLKDVSFEYIKKVAPKKNMYVTYDRELCDKQINDLVNFNIEINKLVDFIRKIRQDEYDLYLVFLDNLFANYTNLKNIYNPQILIELYIALINNNLLTRKALYRLIIIINYMRSDSVQLIELTKLLVEGAPILYNYISNDIFNMGNISGVNIHKTFNFIEKYHDGALFNGNNIYLSNHINYLVHLLRHVNGEDRNNIENFLYRNRIYYRKPSVHTLDIFKMIDIDYSQNTFLEYDLDIYRNILKECTAAEPIEYNLPENYNNIYKLILDHAIGCAIKQPFPFVVELILSNLKNLNISYNFLLNYIEAFVRKVVKTNLEEIFKRDIDLFNNYIFNTNVIERLVFVDNLEMILNFAISLFTTEILKTLKIRNVKYNMLYYDRYSKHVDLIDIKVLSKISFNNFEERIKILEYKKLNRPTDDLNRKFYIFKANPSNLKVFDDYSNREEILKLLQLIIGQLLNVFDDKFYNLLLYILKKDYYYVKIISDYFLYSTNLRRLNIRLISNLLSDNIINYKEFDYVFSLKLKNNEYCNEFLKFILQFLRSTYLSFYFFVNILGALKTVSNRSKEIQSLIGIIDKIGLTYKSLIDNSFAHYIKNYRSDNLYKFIKVRNNFEYFEPAIILKSLADSIINKNHIYQPFFMYYIDRSDTNFLYLFNIEKYPIYTFSFIRLLSKKLALASTCISKKRGRDCNCCCICKPSTQKTSISFTDEEIFKFIVSVLRFLLKATGRNQYYLMQEIFHLFKIIKFHRTKFFSIYHMILNFYIPEKFARLKNFLCSIDFSILSLNNKRLFLYREIRKSSDIDKFKNSNNCKKTVMMALIDNLNENEAPIQKYIVSCKSTILSELIKNRVEAGNPPAQLLKVAKNKSLIN